jgi:hypothetical protein
VIAMVYTREPSALVGMKPEKKAFVAAFCEPCCTLLGAQGVLKFPDTTEWFCYGLALFGMWEICSISLTRA